MTDIDYTKVTCPRCDKRKVGRFEGDPGALTRVPGRSEHLCSPCGTEEALLQFQHGPYAIQHPLVWPVETPLADQIAASLIKH